VREEPFELPVDGGAIRGHRAGEGRPALLLHGGAPIPDYLGRCAKRLDGLFETIRYTQRGTPPSEAPPERIDGVLCIDPLGTDPSVFAGFEARVDETLTEEERARVREIEARRRAGDVTETELVERFRLVWPEVRAPALFVHGEDDPLPSASATGTTALIQGAFVEKIADCGHFPWIEQPEAFRAVVERLVAHVRA
jgi:Alpha/beta hydrolase family